MLCLGLSQRQNGIAKVSNENLICLIMEKPEALSPFPLINPSLKKKKKKKKKKKHKFISL